MIGTGGKLLPSLLLLEKMWSYLSSPQLLPNLYHLRSRGSRGAIEDKLESMAGEVARVMDEQLQVSSHIHTSMFNHS